MTFKREQRKPGKAVKGNSSTQVVWQVNQSRLDYESGGLQEGSLEEKRTLQNR